MFFYLIFTKNNYIIYISFKIKFMQKIRKVAFICFYNKAWKILVQERWDYSKNWEDWSFFWWWIEEWETALEWFFREAKEELGIDMWDFDYDFIWESIFTWVNNTKVYRNFFMIKTDMNIEDFTVYEWAWAKYFSIDEARKLKFPSDPNSTLDLVEDYIKTNLNSK